MIYYHSYLISTSDIPNETSLSISIMGCPNRCPECYSKHLYTIKNGIELSFEELTRIVEEHKKDITCILFMGGDWEPGNLRAFLNFLKKKYKKKYKLALYSGDTYRNILSKSLDKSLDYLKVNPYIAQFGSLTNPKTNQRLYNLENLEDITHLFWS